jgi:phage tail sheath protein FI
MAVMKTPGVYIVEKNAFPNSVVEVATAVPAFIGYTAVADNGGKTLLNKPWRISSMAEFHKYFGFAPASRFTIAPRPAGSPKPAAFNAGGVEYLLAPADGVAGGRYLLYRAMLHFFQNGGGPCYVVSVGDFSQDPALDKLAAGIAPLAKEQEPTMLVVPDAVLLAEPDCISLQQAMLLHCGGVMRNRVAILDIWGGDRDRQSPQGDPIEAFRGALGINNLDFGAAYYPWVNTTLVQEKDLDYTNIANPEALAELLKKELALPDLPEQADPNAPPPPPRVVQQLKAIADLTKSNDEWAAALTAEINKSAKPDADKAKLLEKPALDIAVQTSKALLNKSIASMSDLFKTILSDARAQLNLMPPSAAMAGVYTMVDNARGVWKAPANVSLNAVVSPAVSVSHEDQEDLNVTTQGKSINAIRSFIGEGVLVWGARTLDGNSLDWRYINVRRTMIMLEESCRLAAKAMVFEPNVASTWVTIRSMIGNFLTGIWRRGGLAGAVPDDAFSVHVGLGETMTAEDVLEGILRVTVLVAISRPAEFIEITFQQQMQKS